MKKSLSIFLILCLCTSLFMLTACSKDGSNNGSSTNDVNKDDAMSLIKQSSEYYNNAKNVKLESQILSCMIYNDMFSGEPVICGTTLDVSTVMHNNPLKFTSNVLSTYDDTVEDGGISYIMENNVEMKQYGVFEKDQISIYQKSDEEWVRIDLSQEDFMLNDTLGINYISNYDKYIVDGKVVGKETIDEINTIKAQYTLSEDYLKIMFKKFGFTEFATLIDSVDTDKVILDMMKDTTFTVWFNEKNQEIVKIEVDLTKLMDTFRKVVIDENKQHLSEEKIAYLNECADKILIKNTIRFTNIDENEDFELPEEAKEAKVYGQE